MTPAYLAYMMATPSADDAAFALGMERDFQRITEAERRRVADFGDLLPNAAQQVVEPVTLFGVYDQPHEEIVRVYESQRDAQTFCDENNAYLGFDRYVVETVPANEWADDQVRWAS